MPSKFDSDDFSKVIDKLKVNYRNDAEKMYWPNRLFHFTDLGNAVNIIEQEIIYSREKAVELGLMKNDNASPTVIAQSKTFTKKFVRFYFRPKTPTQFNNEGVRPINELKLDGAHCPLPIFFLFNSKEVLAMEETRFSYGSLAVSAPELFQTASEFNGIPFEYVYHNESLDPEERSQIVFHRHAEVVVPSQISLDSLESIICRTIAERETLINLLSNNAREKWESKIRVDTAGRLYFKRWTFVETATLSTEKIVLGINRGSISGSYHARAVIKEVSTGIEYLWEDTKYSAIGSLTFNLTNLQDTSNYEVRFYLDSNLVYCGNYKDTDNDPF